jgi:hypothetical protein
VQIGYGKNLHFVQAALTDETSSTGVDLAGDKYLTKQRLTKNGKLAFKEKFLEESNRKIELKGEKV